MYIERDSLINIKYKQGRSESVDQCGVLALFTKYYKNGTW